jgi:hypothetical protein
MGDNGLIKTIQMQNAVRLKITVRLALMLLVGLGALLTLEVVATVPPGKYPFYPRCASKQLLNIECPGCGGTRSLHALLNGDLAQAFAYNALLILLLPWLLLICLRSAWQFLCGVPVRPVTSSWFPWVLTVLVILFGLLRNLPVYPLTLLAPHELSR